MDDVSQKAQSLLELNTDSRISHSITQVTTKCQTLLSKAKVSFSSMEHACLNVVIKTHLMWLVAGL